MKENLEQKKYRTCQHTIVLGTPDRQHAVEGKSFNFSMHFLFSKEVCGYSTETAAAGKDHTVIESYVPEGAPYPVWALSFTALKMGK